MVPPTRTRNSPSSTPDSSMRSPAQNRDGNSLATNSLWTLTLATRTCPLAHACRLGRQLSNSTAEPHTGCVKFASRFGNAALRFVSGPEAMQQRRRGANAKIVKSGTVRVGDVANRTA